MTYTKVDKESTALGEFGLHYHEVINGEYAELDPVPKPKRREKYVEHAVVEAVIGAYAEDLQKAYQSNESMEAVLTEQEEQLREYQAKFQEMENQLGQMMEAQKQLKTIEGLMATMEQQMETFSNSKEADQELINSLKEQIADMEGHTEEIEQLREDVEQILANLSSYFVEEGFPPLDSEVYDEYDEQ